MNRNRMLLIGVLALAMSAVLAYLVWTQMTPKALKTGQVVVVAKEKISPGSLLTAKDLKILPLPINVLIAGSYKDTKQVDNRITMVEMFENDLVLEKKLVPKEGGVGGLTAVIDKEKRAISVKVDSVIGVAGFVLPGTHVDVIVTGQPRTNEDPTSKVIVENIKVLTADKTLEKDPEGKAIDSRVVTLLVDPEQATKIALASADGRIQLVLRNSQDNGVNDPRPIGKWELYYGSNKSTKTNAEATKGAKRVARGPNPPPKREADHVFIMISGGKEQKLTLDEWQLGTARSIAGRSQD
jgi:pilus assembly protein CpaB